MRSIFIVLGCTILLVVYVCWRLWRIVPMGWPLKLSVVVLFILWMGMAFASIGFTERMPMGIATLFCKIGPLWLIAFLYLFITFLLADIATLCRLLPKGYLNSSAVGLFTIVGIVAILMIAGHIHYNHKYRKELTITTNKPLERPLKILLASDLHLGYTIGRQELAKWIEQIIAEEPDLVLLCGDIIDRSLRPVIEGGYDEEFRRLKMPLYAVPGNHEYFDNFEAARTFLEGAGIRLLRDESLFYKDICIIGRNDKSSHKGKSKRKSVAELAGNTNGAFTILLDHQPYSLEAAEQAGIDFQFSGHTHRGQVWPISWVTDAMYEKSWGHLVRGSTHYYITSGLGIWGPKIRLGSRSEYLILHIKPLH